MPDELPDYYFRLRENGAAVFRVDTGNRQRRIDLDQIATLNIRNGEIRPHGNHKLSSTETTTIRAWIDTRRAQLAAREIDDIQRTVEALNRTTQWAQSRATDGALADVTDSLLLAMYDLRAVLVRKTAARLASGRQQRPPPRD